MSDKITKILKKYNENPELYIQALNDSTDSANTLIELITATNNNPNLCQYITKHTLISPNNIIAANHKQEDILNLVVLVYLTGSSGLRDITEYYRDEYNKNLVSENFDLSGHCKLCNNIASKLLYNINDHNKVWFIESIISLENIIKELATNLNSLDKTTLSPIMRLYYLLEHANDSLISKDNTDTYTNNIYKISIDLDKIADHLYGTRKKHVFNIAKTLELDDSADYWQASVVDRELILSNYILPDL